MFGLFEIFSKVKHFAAASPIKYVNGELLLDLAEIINQSCEKFSSKYTVKLHPLLFNLHLQIAYSQYFSLNLPIHYTREILSYVDGGRGAVDYVNVTRTVEALNGRSDFVYQRGDAKYNEKNELVELPLPERTERFEDAAFMRLIGNDKPMILLLHGLSGGSQEGYIKQLIEKLVEVNGSDFDIYVLNSRGCADCLASSPNLYNGFWTDDVRYFVNKILKENKDKQIYLVGYSLGGLVLANYIAQESRTNAAISNNLKLAVTISAPLDLLQSSRTLQSTWLTREVYSPLMTQGLCDLVRRNYSQLKFNQYLDKNLLRQIYDGREIPIKYLNEFDREFTSKMFGFNNEEEYYRYGSSIARLQQVRAPMLFISALDDGIVGNVLPYIQVQQNPYLHMLTTSFGSHVCWYESNGDQWYNLPLAQLLKRLNHESLKGTKIVVDEHALPGKTFYQTDRIVFPGSYSDIYRS